MLQFIYKIGDQRVELDQVHNSTLKKSFADLTASFEKHFGTFTCRAHQRSPMIFFHNDGSQAVLSGFGTCCEELGARMRDRIKELGYDSSSLTWTSVTKYTTL